MYKILNEDPPALRDLTRSYPPRTSEVLKKALAKDPGQRYGTCAEFIKDLSTSLEDEKPTVPTRRSVRVPEEASAVRAGDRKMRAWLPWVIALGAAALATAILLVVPGVFDRRPTRPPETAGSPAATQVPERSSAPTGFPAQRPVEKPASPAATLPSAAKPVPPQAPTVAQFTAEPASIQRGQSSMLHWQVNGNTGSVSIDQGIGAVQSTGSRRVSPGESTTYDLTALEPGVTTTASVTVSVTAPPPPAPVVTEFTAEPASIQRGQATTLRWQVNGRTTSVSVDQNVGSVQNAGNRRVSPSESATYTLTAAGPGGTAAANATVSVTAPPPPVVKSGQGVGDAKTERDGLKYMWIPPGTFMMGCSPGDSECDEDEKPAHEVTISKGFWLGQTDVTQAAYRRVIGSNSYSNGDNLPVEQVNWDEARSYCQAIGGRLPTEAEWEYAARAGSTAARYGNLDGIAWYSSSNSNRTYDVGQKQANAFGPYDMLGNVWQWTADWYAAYQGGGTRDLAGPSSGTERTLRGGSGVPRNVRVSVRGGRGPGGRNIVVGFRCVGG
jgi:formylglycine-generating enzyme required for sulfatase activity